MLDQKKHFHCIGIGGIGVSALAELLSAAGYRVTGSDIAASANTQRLEKLGIAVAIGHRPENIAGADHIIYSSAINQNNPEFTAAQSQQLVMWSRGQALAQFVDGAYEGIAIAGTHGKTTTTSLVAHVLSFAGLDPSYAIGGILNNKNSPVQLGKSPYFVAEVDESDASFLYMHPSYAIVTNIDADHLETYQGEFSELKQSFLRFINGVRASGQPGQPGQLGRAYLCVDDPVIAELLPQVTCDYLSYGFSEHAQLRALNYKQVGLVSEFDIQIATDGEDKKSYYSLRLNMPGWHNVQNALAAIAIGRQLGISMALICDALASFPGVGRRFHGHGQMRLRAGQALILEDYGHHPREISATLKAARQVWPERRIVLVFQPHRYSRTRDLYPEFIEVLTQADQLYLLDIYGAGEAPLANINSLGILHAVADAAKKAPVYVPDMALLPAMLREELCDQDVVILQGAGNIGSVAKLLM
jgi:UDP-N-acetylmuramate--alanine ligase